MKSKPLKILNIDDDLGCRLATAEFFTFMGGHMVEVSGNGREGLKKAAEIRPDIILLDMNMPDMNGMEIMDALCACAATRDIPVIIITGADLSDSEQDSLKLKRNFMLLEQKPADFEKLLEKIEAALLPGMPRTKKRGVVLGGSPEPG